MDFWRNYGFSEQCYLKADSVSNLAKAGHAQLQYMKLSPLREISTQGGNRDEDADGLVFCIFVVADHNINTRKHKSEIPFHSIFTEEVREPKERWIRVSQLFQTITLT